MMGISGNSKRRTITGARRNTIYTVYDASRTDGKNGNLLQLLRTTRIKRIALGGDIANKSATHIAIKLHVRNPAQKEDT